MSFFGKFKSGSTPAQAANALQPKKDANAPQPTALEKHLADVSGPVRPDGSDKFFGFENYGSTCYCNSILQCLYYSPHFRDHVINFPSKEFLDSVTIARSQNEGNGAPLAPRSTSSAPFPNPSSPARKIPVPNSPGAGGNVIKPEESKDSSDFKKRMAIQNGPVLEMTDDNSNKFSMDESLFTSLREIFEAIIQHDSRIGVVSPHRFLEILRRENEMFRSAMHQDAHEFLNLLLNEVVDNVESFSKNHPQLPAPHANGAARETTVGSSLSTRPTVPSKGLDTRWVHDLFEGTLTSETRCLTCENTSQRDEAFLDLSVDLESHTSVTSCLRKFSEEEMLCERNKFHCDNCGGLQEAEKRMKIKRLPRILALHLKRFKYTEDLQRLQKLFHRVVYPFYLRLFNTTDDAEEPDRLYELYAVVVHIGGGPYHGHYVSIIKTQDRGWLLFDDELVEPVDKNYVLNFFGGDPVPGAQDAKQLACAYVLFYQETTLEAMLKEQEKEAQPSHAAAAARTSDAEVGNDASLSTRRLDLQQARTNTTPPMGSTEHMDPLSHAQTAPGWAGSATSPKVPLEGPFNAPLSPIVSGKTKKELKAEEKERKLREKAEAKVVEQKRREAANARVENWRKHDAELKRAMEESKTTADEEARKRGEEPAGEKVTGLARFRHSSMSLRNKPRLFSSSVASAAKDKNNNSSNSSAAVSASTTNGTNGTVSLPNHQAAPTSNPIPAGTDIPQRTENGPRSANNGIPSSSLPEHNGFPEEKKLRHRFSLGRKKSQAIS